MMIVLCVDVVAIPDEVELCLQKPKFPSNVESELAVGPPVLEKVVCRHVVSVTLYLLLSPGWSPQFGRDEVNKELVVGDVTAQ